MSTDILVIEDNEQNLYLVTFLLEQSAIRLSRPEADRRIELAGRIQPMQYFSISVAFDGWLYGSAGVRRNPALHDVPIIAVTSYAMVGDKERALDAGCVGYLEKPINPATFVTEIERFLRSAKSTS